MTDRLLVNLTEAELRAIIREEIAAPCAAVVVDRAGFEDYVTRRVREVAADGSRTPPQEASRSAREPRPMSDTGATDAG